MEADEGMRKLVDGLCSRVSEMDRRLTALEGRMEREAIKLMAEIFGKALGKMRIEVESKLVEIPLKATIKGVSAKVNLGGVLKVRDEWPGVCEDFPLGKKGGL